MPLEIPYETERFPPGTVQNGDSTLAVSWDDLLWAAVTVGRPNRHYVFRHGDASRYEALFRWSLVRLALQQSGPRGRRFLRTDAAKTLDPTEKGAVSYFLGMTVCKLFAAKLLNTPWVVHLDVYGEALRAVLGGRSRPDLLGQEQGTNRWHAFECKGRLSYPTTTAKENAKQQAQRVISVGGISCALHIGAITHFRHDVLSFYWRDPEPDRAKAMVVALAPSWHHYYAPVAELLADTVHSLPVVGRSATTVVLDNLDLELSIHEAIAAPLRAGDWERARAAADHAHVELADRGYQPDGLRVKAGPTWSKPFDEAALE